MKFTRIPLLFILLLTARCGTNTNQPSSESKSDPKLILQITVDQLRADLPLKMMDRFPEGGFRYLYENGVVYTNAHHNHSNTETVVGHATLATGANPADHGMIGNLWFDRTLNRPIYNVEDGKYPLIGTSTGVDQDSEIDPTQAAAKTDGRSPNAMLGTTFSDEIFESTQGKSKIFAVSVKDRGAITLAGHKGKAFWFSKSSGDFISSTYYYDEYPDWVRKWNDSKNYLQYENTSWSLAENISEYSYGNSEKDTYKTNLPGFGITFPHNYGSADNPYFTTFLTLSPAGDELTLDFTKNLIEEEDIGTDEITDFLAVSFSSTDYVGHIFGPSSIECEDNLLRLDRYLAQLFELIDQKIGLDNTLIVLSADHGGADAPAVLKAKGQDAGYIDATFLDVEKLNSEVKAKLNVDSDLISAFSYPYIYYNLIELENSNVDKNEVFETLKPYLESIKGIKEAIKLPINTDNQDPNELYYQLVQNNHNADRSGDIALVVEKNWFINDFEGLIVACTHGSPWEYDTHVPIVFAGNGIEGYQVDTRVHTVDIAVTLSDYISINKPSKASGIVLQEITGR